MTILNCHMPRGGNLVNKPKGIFIMKETKAFLRMIESIKNRSSKVRRLFKDSRQFYYPDYYDPESQIEIEHVNGKASLYLHSVTLPHSF